jgi:GxxExxY protein
MDDNDIATVILDCSFRIHRKLGPGLLESVYETVLAKSLSDFGLAVFRQHPIPISFENFEFDEGFRADLFVQSQLIVELKSVQRLTSVHSKQVLTYLRLSGCRLGLLINFNEALLKNGIRRIIN